LLSQHWPVVRVQDPFPAVGGRVKRTGGWEREGVGMERRSLITGMGGRSVPIALAPQRDEVAG